MSSHRLPRHVLPRRYDLNLRPDLSDHVFSGTVSIEVDVVDPVDALVLNAAELSIHSATWTDAGGTAGCVVDLDDDLEQVRLTPPGQVASGGGRLDLAFTGVLNDRLCGFYRSTLLDPDGTTHAIATTQFQATDARRCFPCFDEPDMKAVFGVTLDVPGGLFATSNGAEASRTPLGDGHDRIQFADTIPLSTYLVAFVVGPLAATDPVDVDGVPVRVVHPPGRAHLAEFALDVAAHSLRWFADWYGIPVPGGKVDLVALPDFAFGAMENLGCITFREVLLLVDPETATQRELESVAAVLSHELAHLWFGDLVTMRWWNGIWLNEAFATFMELKAVEAYRPDWEVWTGFGVARTSALDVDSLASTRPIEYPVLTPEDAEGMFDVLTYEKGAAVVRMLEQFLGEEVFRDGVRRYLTEHLHGNTDNEDLWDALEAASGQPVRDLMQAWIFRGGHPLVEATTGDDGSVQLVQSPFRYDGEDEGVRWAVPVRLRTATGEHRLLLDPSRDATAVEAVADIADLHSLNVDASGFYRTTLLPSPGSPATERAAAVADHWAQVLAGRVGHGSFLELAGSLADDTDLGVWQAILGGLTTLDVLAPGRFAGRAAEILGPPIERLGWEASPADDDRSRQLRGLVLAAGGTVAAVDHVIAGARTLGDAPIDDPAVATAVVVVVSAHGDADAYAECRERARRAQTAQVEQRHLRALTRFPGSDEVATLLDELLDGGIRNQDAPYLLRDALAHQWHRGFVWQAVTDRWDEVTSRFPSNRIARMLEGVRSLVDADTDPDVEAFLQAHPVPQGSLQVAQHLERRRVNQRLAERLATS
ncbi:MAG: M1 family metallopeptidase [Actinomycetota bacterium]|nr:M1 family metallopeptidase [Actinomycetota bacterium]